SRGAGRPCWRALLRHHHRRRPLRGSLRLSRLASPYPGRAALMAQFRGYVDNIALQSADKLTTHRTDDGRVVVIEYEVHGTILATGVKYNNRFASIIRIESRKIMHWRDYMDSLAAWNALTAGAR